MRHRFAAVGLALGLAVSICLTMPATAGPAASAGPHNTATPIKHLVVLFDENHTFDNYFGTYPHALNPPGEPRFTPAPGTPAVNGLTPELLTHNPNLSNPQRLDRSQAVTCDSDHAYTSEQTAYDGGKLDRFVQATGQHKTVEQCTGKNLGVDPNYNVMDYYDGNTVTGLWNYAQHFVLNDNSFDTNFGPSTPGHINLVSGQTHGAAPANYSNEIVNGTVIRDPPPAYDDCVNPDAPDKVSLGGRNVGNLLGAKGVTWGWFAGGFRPTSRTSTGRAVCDSTHDNIAGTPVGSYGPGEEPFQYYASTANPQHLPPSTTAAIGHTDQANHQYDLTDFWVAARSGDLPAVSFLKAPGYQQGHPGAGDPLDEQQFLVNTINRLELSPAWASTAVVIAWDDSDGLYDHVMPPIVNTSSDPDYDTLYGAGLCGSTKPGQYQDRCGYGPRQPMLIISPYAKANYVDHTRTDLTSILRFIEDNWQLGRIGDQSFDARAGSLLNAFDFSRGPRADRLFLDPTTGEPVSAGYTQQCHSLRLTADPGSGYVRTDRSIPKTFTVDVSSSTPCTAVGTVRPTVPAGWQVQPTVARIHGLGGDLPSTPEQRLTFTVTPPAGLERGARYSVGFAASLAEESASAEATLTAIDPSRDDAMLLATMSASSTHSGFSPAATNDGITDSTQWSTGPGGGGWNDGTPNGWPDSVTATWTDPVTLSRVDLYTLDSTKYPAGTYGLAAWDVQVRQGSGWNTIAQVRNNTAGTVSSTFTATTTTAVRIVCLASNGRDDYSRIIELEGFADGATSEHLVDLY